MGAIESYGNSAAYFEPTLGTETNEGEDLFTQEFKENSDYWDPEFKNPLNRV